MKNLFNVDRSTIVGFSGGGMLGNETAARLGADRIQAKISVGSTVTGLEPPAVEGQFSLFVNDKGDPTFPMEGGAGGPAKILVALGHKVATRSRPREQATYALAPFGDNVAMTEVAPAPGVAQRIYALHNGTPIVSTMELDTGAHGWPDRRTNHPEDTSVLTQVNGVARTEGLHLNRIIRNIVNGDLADFRVPHASASANTDSF